MQLEAVTLVRVLGTILCLAGIVLCYLVGRKRFTSLSLTDRPKASCSFSSTAAAPLALARSAMRPVIVAVCHCSSTRPVVRSRGNSADVFSGLGTYGRR